MGEFDGDDVEGILFFGVDEVGSMGIKDDIVESGYGSFINVYVFFDEGWVEYEEGSEVFEDDVY